MKRDVPPDVRRQIVRQLAAALAGAWRRQQGDQNPATDESQENDRGAA